MQASRAGLQEELLPDATVDVKSGLLSGAVQGDAAVGRPTMTIRSFFSTDSTQNVRLHETRMSACMRSQSGRVWNLNPGRNGSNGSNGSRGRNGSMNRSHVASGSCHGGDGQRGQDGQRGTDARDAKIVVACTGAPLQNGLIDASRVSASTGLTLNLESNLGATSLSLSGDAFALVDVRGGDGGRGGNGGDGGRGGDGEAGRNGRSGTRGQDARSPGQSGGQGGAGSDGTDGMPAGNGGRGGTGGIGGDAGRGGHLTVSVPLAMKPLLWLVECAASEGSPGAGGSAGRGGAGGRGGRGGNGGAGGPGGRGGPARENIASGRTGQRGPRGRNGRRGADGHRGQDGRSGDNGTRAPCGSVRWQVLDDSGRVTESSNGKFELAAHEWAFSDENNDGIFEPGSTITFSDFQLSNVGGLSCPAGSLLSVASLGQHPTRVPETKSLIVPEVQVSGGRPVCRLSAALTHDIVDLASPPPVNTHYERPLTFASRVRMLGRRFPQGDAVSTTVTVQYPVRVETAIAQTFLGPGEYTAIDITLRNISTRNYGCVPEDTAGDVALHLWLTPLLKFMPQTRRELRFRVPFLPPGKAIKFSFNVRMGQKAAAHLLKRERWGAALLLRGRVIERHEHEIRITPTFTPSKRADVVFFTSPRLDRNNYIAWNQVFTDLGLSVNLWDVERYGGMRDKNRKITWVGTAAHIVFPTFKDPALLRCLDISTVSLHLRSQGRHATGADNVMGSGYRNGLLISGVSRAELLDSVIFDMEQPVSGGGAQCRINDIKTGAGATIGARRDALGLLGRSDKVGYSEAKQRDDEFDEKKATQSWGVSLTFLNPSYCCMTPDQAFFKAARYREREYGRSCWRGSAYAYKAFSTRGASGNCCCVDLGDYLIFRSVVETSAPVVALRSGSDLTAGPDTTRPYDTKGEGLFAARALDAKGFMPLARGGYSDALLALFSILPLGRQIAILLEGGLMAGRYTLSYGGGTLTLAAAALQHLKARVISEFYMGVARSKPNVNPPDYDDNAEGAQLSRYPVKAELLELKGQALQLPGAALAFEAALEQIETDASCLCCDSFTTTRLGELKQTVDDVSRDFPVTPEQRARLKPLLAADRVALKDDLMRPILDAKNAPVTAEPGHEGQPETYLNGVETQRAAWIATAQNLSAMVREKATVQTNVPSLINTYDTTGSGGLNHAELKFAVENDPLFASYLGLDAKSASEFNEQFAKMDISGDGELSYDELMVAVSKFNQGRQAEPVRALATTTGELVRCVPLIAAADLDDGSQGPPPLGDVKAWMPFDARIMTDAGVQPAMGGGPARGSEVPPAFEEKNKAEAAPPMFDGSAPSVGDTKAVVAPSTTTGPPGGAPIADSASAPSAPPSNVL